MRYSTIPRLPLVLCFALHFGVARSQPLPAVLLEEKLLSRIEAFDRNWDGVLGVAAIDLTTNRQIVYHGNTLFAQASSIKIPIMVEIFKQVREGKLALSQIVEINKKYLVGGSGRLQENLNRGEVLHMPLQEVVEAMIIWSDNVATNVCIDLVGLENVNRTLKELGFGMIRLQRQMMDAAAVRRNDENIATPLEMARLAQLLYEGAVVDRAACEAMIGILKQVKAQMRAAVPQAFEVAAKPGGVPAVSCETGIIYFGPRPFVLSVMTTFNGPGDARPIEAITKLAFDYFERLGHSNLYGHRYETPPQ